MKRIPLVFLATMTALAVPAGAGLYVEQTVESTSKGMNLEVRAWTDGDRARVDFVESDNPIFTSGSYLLTLDGGRTVVLVKPSNQTFSVWDLDRIFAGVGLPDGGAEGIVRLDFDDAEVETLGSKPGGRFLGYDTTHRSFRTAFDVEMKFSFVKQKYRSESTLEAWVAEGIDRPALGVWFAVQPPTTGDPDIDGLLTAQMQALEGTPLRTILRSTNISKRREWTVTTEMEVTEIREEEVDTGRFAMPSGYREVPLLDLGLGPREDGQGPLDNLNDLLGGSDR